MNEKNLNNYMLSEAITQESLPITARFGVVKSSLALLYRKSKDADSAKLYQEVPEHFKGALIKELLPLLEESLNNSLDLPSGYLESKFFDMSRSFYEDLGGVVNYDTIKYLHPLLKLLEHDSHTPTNYTHYFESYLTLNPMAIKDYSFIRRSLRLLNDLAISWDIINLYNYRNRFENFIEEITIFDIKELFTHVFSLEIIWMSYAVRGFPLEKVMDREVKELAVLVEAQFQRCLEALMECNKENIEKSSSIEPWLSYLNPALHSKHAFARPKKVKVQYQRFRISYFKGLCCKAEGNAIRLREILSDFELVYREFEAKLVVSLKNLKNL